MGVELGIGVVVSVMPSGAGMIGIGAAPLLMQRLSLDFMELISE